jgi:hypothetical protein
MSNQTAQETQAAPQANPAEQASYWLEEIRLATKSVSKWHERGDKIIKRYRDDRESEASDRRFNVLWSNTETLMPVVFAKPPKPEVMRRFLDKDPVGLMAADMLERATSVSMELYDFEGVMRSAVKDYLLPGRGQLWVLYKPEFGPDGQSLKDERLVCEYVPWKDFLTNPARVWAEVRWCGKRSYLSRDELINLAGPEIGKRVALDMKPNGVDENDPQKLERVSKASVWEIWDRLSGKVWFINTGFSEAPLKVVGAPFNLEGFFPCPRPLTTTTANDSIIPVPDYVEYQDQAEELDDLTARIAALQKSLKVVGVYDSSVTALGGILNDGAENIMVPVDQWAMFASKGGLQGAVSFLPIKEVAEALLQLYQARKSVKDDLYEITGISDILRGSSEASETATAQQIKSQWGSIRVKDRQKDVARFARDVIRIVAEIIAEVFSPETIGKMAGVAQLPPDRQQLAMPAMQLLRDGAGRNFRIDIETDSTILPDEQQEKQNVTEFMAMMGGFMKEAMPVVQMAPPLIPVIGEFLSAASRRFRFGRQLETQIEQAFQQLGQMAQQKAQQPPPPNPEVIKAQAQAQADQMRGQAAMGKAQGELQVQAQKVQGDMALKHAELGLKARQHMHEQMLDRQKQQHDQAMAEAEPADDND